MLSKTVHLKPIQPKNVIRKTTPERAARLHERNAIDETAHDYKPILKTSYDSSIYKFQKEKLSKVPNPNELTLEERNRREPRRGSISQPNQQCHPANYFIYKKKQYNEQLKSIANVPTSNVVSEDMYKTMRSSSHGFGRTPAADRGEEADKRNVYRKNLFISKPFAEINKDFKFQPLVRNAQTTSEDTPYWFQGTAKFYTQENFDLTKKMRTNMSNLPKTDIFGKNDVTYPKTEYPFVAQVPSKGQRYELNRMVVVEKKTANDYNPRVPHVKLRWEEETQKQSYDKARVTWKVGDAAQPFIKKIKAKETFDPMVAYKKVGEYDNAARIKQEKAVDIKIGHPNNEYVYGKKKEREDGFLGNRKQITGANYQTSSFFFG